MRLPLDSPRYRLTPSPRGSPVPSRAYSYASQADLLAASLDSSRHLPRADPQPSLRRSYADAAQADPFVASGSSMRPGHWKQMEHGQPPPAWSTRSRHLCGEPSIPLPPLVPLTLFTPRLRPPAGFVLEEDPASGRPASPEKAREALSLSRLQATSQQAVAGASARLNPPSPRNHGGGTRSNIAARAARFSAASACQSLLEGVARPEEVANELIYLMDERTAYDWMVTFCHSVERAGATLDSVQRQLITQQEQMERFMDRVTLGVEGEAGEESDSDRGESQGEH